MPDHAVPARLERALRLGRTLVHLRPTQFAGRAWRLAGLHRVPRASDRAPAPRLRPGRDGAGAWQPCRRPPSMTAPDGFTFLSEAHALGPRGNWDNPAWPRLWRYNLHYFDDLVADGAGARVDWHRDLIARWLAENPPAKGTAWEPYPLSLRIVNWLKWLMTGEAPMPAMIDSLATQARLLLRQREYHLLGNHLWANGKALAFAGCCFEGPEADRWLAAGMAILKAQFREQVLADGGHFERTPMYHGIFCEDVLDILQLDQRFPGRLDPDWVRQARTSLPALLRWLAVMSHPDGGIALFNDAALGIAPDLAALQAQARALALDHQFAPLGDFEPLVDSGYVRLANERAVVIIDVGLIGPDYLPGHAHADTLSLELSVDGRRVLVNGGTSTYAVGPERQRQRGTPAHNTVAIDGLDSSEVWGGFRVGRRAHPVGVEARPGSVSAGHDGYRHLPGRPMPWRQIDLAPEGLTVVDRLGCGSRDGRENRQQVAVACYRFAAGWALAPLNPGAVDEGEGGASWQLSGEGGPLALMVKAGRARVIRASWHPRFGQTRAVDGLEITLDDNDKAAASLEIHW